MWILFLATACGPEEPADGDDVGDDSTAPSCTDVFYADYDGDEHGDLASPTTACSAPEGYTTSSDDCDDQDTTVHPGAGEVCNGLDDDCDGTVDVGATDVPTWYTDADGDGYGDDWSAVVQCDRPSGYVDVGGDCADGEPLVNPDADEICNDIDDNCDTLLDAADPMLLDGLPWYADSDADGYGDPFDSIIECDQLSGYLPEATDCDDTRPWVHPGVTEVCDLIDNDCDGYVDDDDDELVSSTFFYADTDGDTYGDARNSVDACELPKGFVENDFDCDDTLPDVNIAAEYYYDSDGDGYGSGPTHRACVPAGDEVLVDGDCRSTDATVYPDAPKICDGKDNNCDGTTDEADALIIWDTWYADADRDHWGDPSDTIESCDGAVGYVRDAGDCDEADATIHPEAPEYCDSIDNDCNGATDDSVVYEDWYADADGDGFGNPSDTINDCVAPEAHVLDATDCDDGDAEVSPDGVEECGNGRDNDCDGYVDNCVADPANADAVVRGVDTNSYSASTLATGDFDADGTPDLVDGAPYYAGGRVYLSFGPLKGETDVKDGVTLSPLASIAFGDSLAAGDANGDGYDDVLVGAPVSADASFLFLGPLTADADTSTADLTVGASAAGSGGSADYLSFDVRIASDVSGDGANDVVLTAPYTASYGGAVYVVDGTTSGTVTAGPAATYVYEGPGASNYFGWSAADVGDMDGDGIADLGMVSSGTAYLVTGGAPAGIYVVNVVATAAVSPLHGFSGSWGDFDSIEGTDYNQDGYGDLLVGDVYASSGSWRGAVYAFLGPVTGTVSTVADPDVTWWGDYVGCDIDVADVNGDKAADVLLLGNSKDFLALGPSTGAVDLTKVAVFPNTTFGTVWEGSVLFTPDWSGDDLPEIAIGAPGSRTPDDGTNGGAAYIYYSEHFY